MASLYCEVRGGFFFFREQAARPIGKRAADGRNGGSDSGKGRLERGKTGADGRFRGGNCHVGKGVFTAVFATRREKIFSLPWEQNSAREHDKRDK